MISRCDSDGQQLRIGGEFELTPHDLLRAPGRTLPSFGRTHEIWTDTGRGALSLAAHDILRKGGGRRVWLPAYCCDSVAQPFRESGFDIVYYPVGERLDASAIPLPQPAAGEVFLFIHYFGHRNSVLEAHAAALRDRGVWVVEDCVQAGLSGGLGRTGHYAVASYRKLLPQPDGALLSTDQPVSVPALPEADEQFVSQRTWGKLLRGLDAPADTFLPWFECSERALDERVIARQPSWLAMQLMARADLQAIAQQRCANWHALAQQLVPGLQPVYTRLATGEVPLGFPVTVDPDIRDTLRAFLGENRIFCPVHWRLPHVPGHSQFAVEHALERSMLTLPIDQRMTGTHIERLVAVLARFFGVTA